MLHSSVQVVPTADSNHIVLYAVYCLCVYCKLVLCDADNTVVPAQAVVGIAVSFDGGVSHYIRLPPRTPLFPKAWGEC
jgi:hypothetical protein